MIRSDDELLTRLRTGEPHAYRALYERHGARLLRLARRILGQRQDAEDAVQESFLACYRRIRSFRGEGALATWLTRIAINVCLRALRRRAAQREKSGREAELRALWEEPDHGEDAESERLRRALAELPAQQRLVFLLAEVDGLARTEIAARLDLNPATVRFHLCKAKERLRARLGSRLDPRGVTACGSSERR